MSAPVGTMAPGTRAQQSNRVGKYYLSKTLGQGAFGKVKLAVHEDTGVRYAVKIMDKIKIRDKEMSQQVRREIKAMKELSHPNIVSLHEVLMSKLRIYMVMDLVDGGELYDELTRRGPFDENEARTMFKQLTEGMLYCHQRSVYHRDLKFDNLLLDENGAIKIGDFGLVSIKGADAASDLLHTQVGTPHYTAPEIITGASGGYDGVKVDVWSSAIILYGLVEGSLPFMDEDHRVLYDNIVNKPVAYPEYFSKELVSLLEHMFEKNPEKRYTFWDVKKHPWYCEGTVYDGDSQAELSVSSAAGKKKKKKKSSDGGEKPRSNPSSDTDNKRIRRTRSSKSLGEEANQNLEAPTTPKTPSSPPDPDQEDREALAAAKSDNEKDSRSWMRKMLGIGPKASMPGVLKDSTSGVASVEPTLRPGGVRNLVNRFSKDGEETAAQTSLTSQASQEKGSTPARLISSVRARRGRSREASTSRPNSKSASRDRSREASRPVTPETRTPETRTPETSTIAKKPGEDMVAGGQSVDSRFHKDDSLRSSTGSVAVEGRDKVVRPSSLSPAMNALEPHAEVASEAFSPAPPVMSPGPYAADGSSAEPRFPSEPMRIMAAASDPNLNRNLRLDGRRMSELQVAPIGAETARTGGLEPKTAGRFGEKFRDKSAPTILLANDTSEQPGADDDLSLRLDNLDLREDLDRPDDSHRSPGTALGAGQVASMGSSSRRERRVKGSANRGASPSASVGSRGSSVVVPKQDRWGSYAQPHSEAPSHMNGGLRKSSSQSSLASSPADGVAEEITIGDGALAPVGGESVQSSEGAPQDVPFPDGPPRTAWYDDSEYVGAVDNVVFGEGLNEIKVDRGGRIFARADLLSLRTRASGPYATCGHGRQVQKPWPSMS